MVGLQDLLKNVYLQTEILNKTKECLCDLFYLNKCLIQVVKTK